MKKSKFFLALLAILFGFFIFTSSLVTQSQKETVSAKKVSTKKFYLGEKILPDHILYPLVMVVDRSLLAVSSGDSKVFLQIRLAQDRMITAKKLLEKEEEILALSTLTKSQKYLILAIHDVFSKDGYSKDTARALLMALKDNTQNLAQIESQFKTIPTGPVGDLISESTMLISIIEGKVK